jgi:pimeloyl-ACP methyl ester carboxylesterase
VSTPHALRADFVQANGIRLHTMQAGEGPLILFLHGFPQFWYAWRHQLAEFARDHLAVAPDLRGYNLSDKPDGVDAYKARHIVADIRDLARQLNGGKPFTLVAHDWGGAVAWNLASAAPELVSRLVILNSPHPYAFWRELVHSPAQQKASEYMLKLRSPQAEARLSENGYARLWKFAFGETAPAFTDADRAAYLQAWAQPGALTGSLNWYRASPLIPPTADDPGAARLRLDPKDFMVRVPTLVIHGERDSALLTGLLDGLEHCVPVLEIERIPEASHWVMEEMPARVNQRIRAFLAPL